MSAKKGPLRVLVPEYQHSLISRGTKYHSKEIVTKSPNKNLKKVNLINNLQPGINKS